MMVVAVERRAKPRPKLDEVEQIKRLIDVQTQIVELAKQNEITQQQCKALRRELERGLRSPVLWRRIAHWVCGLFGGGKSRYGNDGNLN